MPMYKPRTRLRYVHMDASISSSIGSMICDEIIDTTPKGSAVIGLHKGRSFYTS